MDEMRTHRCTPTALPQEARSRPRVRRLGTVAVALGALLTIGACTEPAGGTDAPPAASGEPAPSASVGKGDY